MQINEVVWTDFGVQYISRLLTRMLAHHAPPPTNDNPELPRRSSSPKCEIFNRRVKIGIHHYFTHSDYSRVVFIWNPKTIESRNVLWSLDLRKRSLHMLYRYDNRPTFSAGQRHHKSIFNVEKAHPSYHGNTGTHA